jgi:hypothetical protein
MVSIARCRASAVGVRKLQACSSMMRLCTSPWVRGIFGGIMQSVVNYSTIKKKPTVTSFGDISDGTQILVDSFSFMLNERNEI